MVETLLSINSLLNINIYIYIILQKQKKKKKKKKKKINNYFFKIIFYIKIY